MLRFGARRLFALIPLLTALVACEESSPADGEGGDGQGGEDGNQGGGGEGGQAELPPEPTTHFEAEPTSFQVPEGGRHLAGFNDLSREPGVSDDVAFGAQRWRMIDLDGDGAQDLVVTATAGPRDGYYFWNEVPGYESDAPKWLVYQNDGAGFAADPTEWPVPVGGTYLAGFNDLAGEPGVSDDVEYGAQRWRTLDIDGDGLPDLVVTATAVARDGYYFWDEVPGYDGAPKWLVYKNNGAGFDAEPVEWSVPEGGRYLAGFNDLSGEPGVSDDVEYGAHRWRTLDIDGDALPDLVVTATAVPRDGYYFWDEVPGYDDGAPQWQVYKNNGAGFDAEPIAWNVPEGGAHLAGFNDLSGEPGYSDDVAYGDERWRLLDMDADQMPDIVVTATATPRDGYYFWNEVPGYDDETPYWHVYRNNGGGFDSEPTAWSVPAGGAHLAGFNDLGGEPGYSDDVSMGDDRWSVLDLNTDGRPDLVVTGEATPREGYYFWVQIFGFDAEPKWWVYLGGDGGFAADPTPWAMPLGGQHLAGFAAPSGEPGYSDDVSIGADRWRLVDVDGDHRQDLVIVGDAQPRDGYYFWVEVLGFDAEPRWQVYRGAP